MGAAVATVAALVVLSGCTAVPPEIAPTPPPTTVTVGTVGQLTSFNPETAHGATGANLAVAQYLQESFAFIGDDLQVTANMGFGEVEKISDDPLTVVYTLHEGRMWSDGTLVSLEDLLFGWAVSSGWFDDATYDEQGNVVSGTRYFDTADTPAPYRNTSRAELNTRQRTLTVTYDDPFADWNRQWLLDRPVHVVAAKAGLPAGEILRAIRESPQGDPEAPAEPNPVLLAAGKAWSTGFDVDPNAPDLSTAVSNGPYLAESWQGDRLELARNPDYAGTHYPAFDRLTVRFFPDDEAQLAAVRSGEVDVANLGSLSEASIADLESSGADILTGPRPRTISLVFVDEAERLEETTREALMLSLDRDELVAETVKATNPDAAPLRSFLASAASGSAYDDIIADNGSPGGGADTRRAAELLDGDEPQVRVRYDPTDPLSADLFTEITRMADVVGIDVRSATGDDPADAELVSSEVTASLYETARERVVGGAGGADAVRALIEMRESTDPEHVVEVAQEIDRELFDDLYGMPLVEASGVVAHSATVGGVSYTASPWGAPREFWTWQPLN
ncbi:ABC transporter substrate-binding protein [Microbacterium sp. P07]|uniref:ABC transporter substrate-binding protein n=1 Tax=Microbacterium sp. P07 TaxID=3366952 RepID=UPI0037477A6C